MTGPRTDVAVWSAAVNAALLGTDRTPLTVPSAGGSLGSACVALVRDETDGAAAVLRVAAAASRYRRCGWSPGRTDEPIPPACPPEPRPLCAPAAAALLRRILHGEHEALLGAWLALAVEHGVRAPADALGALLDTGRQARELRSLIVAAGGTRATWLAGFNEGWSYAVASESADVLVAAFETGTTAARLAALQQLRVLDAERARAELEKSWEQENPTDRATFIAALARGLSTADEPFLERALDDRRKEVRQQAARLLASLPGSALVVRMAERAAGLISLGTSRVLGRLRIDVALPSAADPAVVRDGVDPRPPTGSGIGERAWWLAQIVGAVPPSTWSSRWSLDATAVLKAVDGHEWREPVVAGWLTATERYRDETWARALWENERFVRVDSPWGAPSAAHVFTTVVPSDQVDAELRRTIEADRGVLRENQQVLAAILESPHEWSDALARAVARRLKEHAGDRVPLTAEFGIRALLERCAHAVPVSAVDAYLSGWPEHADVWPTWATAIDTLASVLRFRSDLHLAFNV